MSTTTSTRDDLVYELQEIQSEILERVNRAKELLKASGFEGALMRAESYWMAHVITAVSNDHYYFGGSMVSLQDTIDEIETAEDEEEADED